MSYFIGVSFFFCVWRSFQSFSTKGRCWDKLGTGWTRPEVCGRWEASEISLRRDQNLQTSGRVLRTVVGQHLADGLRVREASHIRCAQGSNRRHWIRRNLFFGSVRFEASTADGEPDEKPRTEHHHVARPPREARSR